MRSRSTGRACGTGSRGTADLVLVHAAAGDLRMWDGVVAELGDRMRCVRLDLRGFGRTTSPRGPFSPVADMEAVLAALDVTGASSPEHRSAASSRSSSRAPIRAASAASCCSIPSCLITSGRRR